MHVSEMPVSENTLIYSRNDKNKQLYEEKRVGSTK